jgi:hypothetical protein
MNSAVDAHPVRLVVDDDLWRPLSQQEPELTAV